MGELALVGSDRSYTLSARSVAGRSAVCAVRLEDPLASAEHAVLWWNDGRWWIRDLGSRNGTSVDGRRLGPGEAVALVAGSRMTFGNDAARWDLVEDGAPVPMAERLSDGLRVRAVHGYLALEDEAEPDLVVYADLAGRWVAETPEQVAAVEDGAVILAAGRPWRLRLPSAVSATQEPRPGDDAAVVTVAFEVSRDEEHVQVRLGLAGRSVELPDRAFNYALLTLARARQDDAQLPPSEQGWRYVDEVCASLRLPRRTFNVYVHRLRRAFGEAGVRDGAGIVERRHQADQIRLGIGDVRIRRA